MRGRIKSSEFIQFDFYASASSKTDLECSYSFKAQYPIDTDDKVLAILVSFQADTPEDSVHFHAQCRVVFDFTDIGELPNENDLISGNYNAAYQEFCKKSNEALLILGQNRFDFQEI